MKHETLTLHIPPGVKWISIDYHDGEEENNVQEAFEEAERQGVATTKLTHEDAPGLPLSTGLDILRSRGTPIELIGSYILAGDWDAARAAFRTSILEYVYEKIATFTNAHVQFINSKNSAIIKHAGTIVTIGLTAEHDTHVHHGSCTPSLCMVKSGDVSEGIHDHITATVMAIIEVITGNIIAEITTPLDKALTQHRNGTLEIRIIVNLFEYGLTADAKEITAYANVPMIAYWLGQN